VSGGGGGGLGLDEGPNLKNFIPLSIIPKGYFTSSGFITGQKFLTIYINYI